MKICMVTRTTVAHSPGGMQQDLQTLAEGLVEAGHRVTVITTQHPDGMSVGETRGVEIHYLRDTIPEFYMGRFYRSTIRAEAASDHEDEEL